METSFVTEELKEASGPLEALARLRGVPGRVLLHSAPPGRGYSFLGADPSFRMRSGRGCTRLVGRRGMAGRTCFPDPFTAIEEMEERFRTPPPPDGIPFAGGWIGYLAYEAADALEAFPAPPPDDIGLPEAWFGLYDRGILWDWASDRCRAVASVLPGRRPEDARRALTELIARVTGAGNHDSTHPGGLGPTGEVTSSLDRARFMEGVERIRERILAGDLFQANLTRRISVPTPLGGEALFRRMLRESPATFSAYLDVGTGEVASISPELFLSVRAGKVSTRPIKGTAPRGASEREDRALREGLGVSPKDRAENVMIVDLLRNDLARVSRAGSVSVPALAEIESHPTVHHLASTVEGELLPDVGPAALLRATFPGGSITGAPKIQAIRLLRELEPVRRGVYTGALGILALHGDLDLSVAIRTAVVRNGQAHYGTGGGITLGSDARAEWKETEDKAEAFLRAVGVNGWTVPPLSADPGGANVMG